MTIDHITLGQTLSQSRAKCLKLAAAASVAYPKTDPFVQDLFTQIQAFDLLKSKMDSVFHGETSDAEFENLGHPYYPQRSSDHSEPDIGIAIYRPRIGNRKRRFSSDETLAARTCLREVSESLKNAKEVISDYGSQHGVLVVLKYAQFRNRVAGSHVGLWTEEATT